MLMLVRQLTVRVVVHVRRSTVRKLCLTLLFTVTVSFLC